MRKPKHVKIYASKLHLIVTLLTIILPFVFIMFFSKLVHVASATLFLNLLISFVRLLVAYIIAVILSWIAAVFFYKGRSGDIALPIFDVLQSFPTFAALPLAAYFWGVSNFTVIFFLVITVIWPIFFSVVSSLKLIKHDWEEAVQIAGLRGWNYLRYFLWPVSIPGLVTGSIIGLGEGWEALVATEIIVGMQSGLGIFFQSNSTNTLVTSFGILGLLIIIFSINKIIWLPLLEKSHREMEE